MTDTPKGPRLKWLEDNHDRARRSNKHERRIGQKMGGRRLPGSGGKQWSASDKNTHRGDVQTPVLLIEHKRTDKQSMAVKKEWLDKVRAGAERVMRDPALILTFEHDGKVDDWIMLPLDVARRLLGIEDE